MQAACETCKKLMQASSDANYKLKITKATINFFLPLTFYAGEKKRLNFCLFVLICQKFREKRKNEVR